MLFIWHAVNDVYGMILKDIVGYQILELTLIKLVTELNTETNSFLGF